jgi:hypothetical protein
MVLNKIPTFQEVKDWVNNEADVYGPDYIQLSKPSSPSDGETWVDTSDSARPMFIYSTDRGEWVPTFENVPLFVTQEAVSFAESDVNLTTSDAEVVNGSARLLEEYSQTANINTGNQVSSTDSNYEYGVKVDIKKPVFEITILTDGLSYVDNFYIFDSSGNELVSSAVSDPTTVSVSLDPGIYYLECSGNSSQTNGGSLDSGEIFDVVSGSINQSEDSDIWNFTDITMKSAGSTSGSATAGFDDVEDLETWDRVSWQTDDGDGSVTATVETDDGTGWSEFAADVAAPYSIAPVPAEDDVRVRFDLSRPTADDTSPLVSYVARRGER